LQFRPSQIKSAAVHTGVGKSRASVVRVEKYMQVMIIKIALIIIIIIQINNIIINK
jgi:hypothetical protein